MKKILALLMVFILTLALLACTEEIKDMSTEEQSKQQEASLSESAPEESAEESLPEESVPEESSPEESVPEESVPEESVPETSVPETSVPEESAPAEPKTEILFDSSNMQNYTSPFLASYAPFALYDTTAFSDAVITSISFPYYGLADGYTVDSDGLYMPVYVIKSDLSAKREDCQRIILDFTGKLDGVKRGDWLVVSGLNITVGADETLAFGDTDMAVLPAFLRNDGTHGFWNKVFDTKGTNNHSLIFKIEGIKNNTSIPSIDDGKKTISFLGDSISTYAGWSNNKSHNPSIGGNALWYPNTNYAGANMPVEDTWWHRVFTEIGYELCVNNSWSGSKVTDPHTYNVRSRNLHNVAEGTSPDIVVILMGINDFGAGIKVGDYDGTTTPPPSPATFSEAYGKLIHNVKSTYEGVEIYCCTVLPDEKRDVSGSESPYNAAIKLLAENMGVNLIDLYAESGITSENITSFTVDKLHPNSAGMARMAAVIVNAINENQ